jgi:tetraacyldisaccharide 4'-kinase
MTSLRNKIDAWLQTEWYARAAPNGALLPWEIVFRQAVRLRRYAYRKGFGESCRLPVPVIVVGNLTVGGTGKTPLVIWLAALLRRAGYRPGVISRGYGAAAGSVPLPVAADSDPRRVGDEPVLIARRTGCPVCVHPRRAAAGRVLLESAGCDVLIADDGLQHYALARDVEIAVVDGRRGFGNGHCLPAGPLREPPERLNAVDFVVYSGDGPPGGTVMVLEGREAVNLADETLRRPLQSFAGEAVHAVAGIGHPQRFFAHLQGFGLRCDCREFPDHHDFRREDLEPPGHGPVLMTEKDAVKCFALAGPRYWYVPVDAKLPAAFGENLLQLLKAKHDGQKAA